MRRETPHEKGEKPPRVCIIEDDDILRRGLSRLFEREGFVVRADDSGESALEELLSEEKPDPDLLICDYKLPGMNGLEVLAELRKNGSEAAFILVTAYYSEELNSEAKRKGADSVTEKPIEIGRLLSECRRIYWERVERKSTKQTSLSPSGKDR